MTCPICWNAYRIPFMALCGHAFCAACVHQIIHDVFPVCPTCRVPIERLINAFAMRLPSDPDPTDEERSVCDCLEGFEIESDYDYDEDEDGSDEEEPEGGEALPVHSFDEDEQGAAPPPETGL